MGIPHELVKGRVDRVRSRMQKAGLEALVVYGGPSDLGHATSTSGYVHYLTDWSGKSVPSLLVLPAKEDAVLVVPSPLDYRWVREQDIWIKDIRMAESPAVYGAAARALLVQRDVQRGRVGLVGKAEMTVPIYVDLTAEPCPFEFVDADEVVTRERMVNQPEDIELLRMAAKVSDAMLSTAMNSARQPGKWDYQLMAEIDYTGRCMGADLAQSWLTSGPAPDFIFTSHQIWRRRRQLEPGDRVHAGTYVIYEGHWAHGIRMAIKGKASADLRRYVDGVIEVQNAGMNALKPGKRVSDVAAAMESVVDEYSPYSKNQDPFRFRAGHGLGLQYGDPILTEDFPQPSAWKGSFPISAAHSAGQDSLILQPGMVFELHPNFTTDGLGFVCMGDVVLVTDSGPELLTQIPRALFEI